MTSAAAQTARPPEDSWIVAIHLSERDLSPIGSGLLIDDHRVLTCAHVVCADGEPRPELWLAFPNSLVLMHRRIRVRDVLVPPAKRQVYEDAAVLELTESLGRHPVARLRTPNPRELTGREWWSFGFPAGDALGMPATGTVGEPHGYGWLGLDTNRTLRPGRGVTQGYSGAALWCSAYDAVVGIIGQADDAGDARALTISHIDLALPQAKLGRLAQWRVEAVEESTLASWGWSLSDDPEAERHWRPRARGVARESERGFRFRGRRAALTTLVEWITADRPQHTALAVIGSPGVGKSAVLGRIVTSADAEIAADLPDTDSAVRAPVGSIACAVHAKGKTALDLAVEIAKAASAPLPRQTGELANCLARALAMQPGRTFAVVIDALDEATTPAEAREIIRQIVRPLVEDLADVGVKVLVGARRSDDQGSLLTDFGTSITELDLDDPAYFELEDLEAYALASLQLLGAERHGNPYEDDAVAVPLAARIAELSEGNFLVAGLVSRAHGLHDRTPVEPGSIAFSPKVDDALDEFLDRIPSVGGRSAHELLTALAYAEAPGFTVALWRSAVRALYGNSPETEALSGFARTSAANFLIEDTTAVSGGGHERTYRLFHQALNDVLLVARDATDVDERAIAQVLSWQGQTCNWRNAPAYLLRSLPRHAARGGLLSELLKDNEYLLHADLRRLLLTAVHSDEAQAEIPERIELLRKSQRAFDSAPEARAALFSIVEAQEQLGRSFQTRATRADFRAQWAQTTRDEALTTLEGHNLPVNVLASVPLDTGKQVLVSGGSDGTVRVWDPDTAEIVRVIRSNKSHVSALCPVRSVDQRVLIAVAGLVDGVCLWDPETGELVRTLGTFYNLTRLCGVTGANGRTLLAGLGMGEAVHIWDVETGKYIRSLPRTKEPLSLCAISFRGEHELLAVGKKDGSVHLWNLHTGTPMRLTAGNGEAAVTALHPIPAQDGTQLLAIGRDDKSIQLWDASACRRNVKFSGEAEVAGICAVPSKRGHSILMISLKGRELEVWDPYWEGASEWKADSVTVSESTGRAHSICPIMTTDGDTLVATAGLDGAVRLWGSTRRTDALSQFRSRFDEQIMVRSWTQADGVDLLFSLSEDGIFRQWHPDTGSAVRSWSRGDWTGRVVELIHGHDVPLFVIADTKGAMTLTGVSGKPFWHRENPPPGEGDSAVITAIATLPGEQEEDSQLVTADEDGKLRRWNLRDGLPSGPPISIGAGADAVRSICICDDPHGRLIAGMTDGNQILVWRVDDGELLWTLGERTDENWLGQYPRVFSIPGERNPSLVGAFTVDETLTLWNLGTGDVHCEVERDGYWLNTAHAFKGPSGRTLIATGGLDRTVRVWDLDGRAVMEIPVRHEILDISSSGNRLFLGFTDGVMAIDIDDTLVMT